MPSKSFESKLYDWAKEHAQVLGEDAYNKIIAILEKEAPEALEVKRRGRKPKEDEEAFYYYFEEVPKRLIRFGGFKAFNRPWGAWELLNCMFNFLSVNTGESWAKMAFVLTEMGVIKSVGNKGERWDCTDMEMYYMICYHKYSPYKKNSNEIIGYRTFKSAVDDIRNGDKEFSEEEKKEWKQHIIEYVCFYQSILYNDIIYYEDFDSDEFPFWY